MLVVTVMVLSLALLLSILLLIGAAIREKGLTLVIRQKSDVVSKLEKEVVSLAAVIQVVKEQEARVLQATRPKV